MNNHLAEVLAILAQRSGRSLTSLIEADDNSLREILARIATVPPPPRWQDDIIVDAISAPATVLDLGCGVGELLLTLAAKGIQGQGVELDEDAVMTCVERGVPVIHANIELGLKSFPDASVDVAVCEQTLQTLHRPVAVLEEMLRVSRRAIASFPNFGHWRLRLDLALNGRMPTSSGLPHAWYDTPNIHLFTIADFTDWVNSHGYQVAAAWALVDGQVRPIAESDNVLAEEALFVIERPLPY